MSFVVWFMASFLYCFPYIAIAIVIVGRAITLEREPTKNKQRTNKKDEKRIKSDNFTRGNREKSNIAIAILEI